MIGVALRNGRFICLLRKAFAWLGSIGDGLDCIQHVGACCDRTLKALELLHYTLEVV